MCVELDEDRRRKLKSVPWRKGQYVCLRRGLVRECYIPTINYTNKHYANSIQCYSNESNSSLFYYSLSNSCSRISYDFD